MDNRKELFGHPMGLYILFFTELWERFSYYGMRALLVLFLVASASGVNPGFGWSKVEALSLYGTYTALVYIASIPGGILADKLLGQKKTVMLGGWLLVAGHGILAIRAEWAFYLGLCLIVAGVGCLKPNISTMVGGLYAQNDDRRDKAFTIFYIGINIGALIAGVLVGSVGVNFGWHFGFGLAGIGMAIGQLVFMLGQKHLVGVGEATASLPESERLAAKNPLTKIEKDRMIVMFLSFIMIIVFWGAFEQAGGLMNLYADEKTNRMLSFINFEIPAPWFQSVNSFFIITLGSAVAAFWYKRKKKGKESSSIFKMAIGTIIMGWGFFFMSAASMQFQADGSSAMYWLVLAYMFHTIGELCASPVALSFITKLAPLKYASLMMGAYFAATGMGNYVSGWVGEYSQTAGELEIFTGIAIFCTIFGLLVLLIIKPLKRLAHGAEDAVPDQINNPLKNTEQIETV
ncbi:peptide MFS transporter [Pedobacter arcticus]|uniref:peptide MFS transporter n=1 Tax=Pedobacter arcticus TaxID=752140 RepID=UPI000371FC3B|nr:peptide MFS transporter [Pedobacter arcticus]